MSYLRRPDLSVFFWVSLHSPFSATIPPYSSRHASVIRIYVDSSISSYVLHQPAFFIEHRHMYTCPTVQGKDPPLTYWLISYGVFSTSPRVPLSSMNGDSPYYPPLLSAPTRRPASLSLPDYSGRLYPAPTAPTDPRLTPHRSCIPSCFPIDVTARLYVPGQPCSLPLLSTQRDVHWH